MMGQSNFWTPTLKRDFHLAVRELRRITETPSSESYYRDTHTPRASQHILYFTEEIQFVDDLAFLAHREEGVKAVSAVTVQEKKDSLAIIVASNHTPMEKVIADLTELLSIANQYAEKSDKRQSYCPKMFEKVIELSSNRIIGRIRPPWAPQPAKHKEPNPSLRHQLQSLLREAKRLGWNNTDMRDLIHSTTALVKCLKPFEAFVPEAARQQLLKDVIERCVSITKIGGQRSLVEFLRKQRVPQSVLERREIHQIDKLARYFYVCRDIIKIVRRPDCRPLFRNVTIKSLEAFPGLRPDGASSHCFVHAEIQQVLYHEKHPNEPPPRVIGSSKSACYLCDMFLRTQGKYCISRSHKRLYEKWTLPDINWMSVDQTKQFRTIIKSMTMELRRVATQSRNKQRVHIARPFGLESKAFLPLSSESTLSRISGTPSQALITRSSLMNVDVNPEGVQQPEVADEGSAGTEFSITANSLPFYHTVQERQKTLHITVGAISLILEFFSAGYLSILMVGDHEEMPENMISVLELPEDRETNLKKPPSSASHMLCLSHPEQRPIQVKFGREQEMIVIN